MKQISVNFIVVLFFFFTACTYVGLDEVVDHPEDYAVVYLRQALDGSVPYTFPVVDEEQVILLNANYGGVDYPAADIRVNLSVKPELAAAYNEANLTAYPVLPANAYSLTETSAVIPQGKLYSSSVVLKVKMTNMPGIAPHLLPVTIESVSDGLKINEKLRTVYFLVGGTYYLNPFPYFDRLGWTATASSTNGANAVTRLLDGDSSTYWSTLLTSSPPHEITVNLGREAMVHGLAIDARRATANSAEARDAGNPARVIVRTSTDNVNWTSDEFTLKADITKPEETLYFGYARQASYVKLIILSSTGELSYTWFSELNIF